MEITAQVVMLPTTKAADDFVLFKHTHDWRGELIFNPKLEFSDNPTFIRNIKLITSGKAATNAMDKYMFFELYFTLFEEIKAGDNVIDNVGRVWNNIESCFTKVINTQGGGLKIMASTNKSLLLPIPDSIAEYPLSYTQKELPQIPELFIKKFAERNGEIKDVNIEVYPNTEPFMPSEWGMPMLKKDNTVIINSYTGLVTEYKEIKNES